MAKIGPVYVDEKYLNLDDISQLNRLMIAEGWTRARRRSFWREFIGEADKVSKLESIERENKNV